MKNVFLTKKFNSLFVSATLSILISMSLQIIGSVIAGNIVGEKAISAINIISPMHAAVIFLGTLLVRGSGILFSKAAGKGDKDAMSKIFSLGFFASIFFGIFAFVVSQICVNNYIASYNISNELSVMSKNYYMYYSFVFLLCPLFVYMGEMVYMDGDGQICNISNTFNLIGTTILSYVFCKMWGVKGVGFGTSVSMAIATIILFIHFVKKSNNLKITFGFDIVNLIQIMKYSFLDASIYLNSSIATICINALIVKKFGEMFLPVFSVLLILVELNAALDGVGQVLAPFVSVYRSERNNDGENKIIKMSLLYALIEGAAFTIIFFALSKIIPQLVGIKQKEVFDACVISIRIMAFTSFFTSIIFVITSYNLLTDHILLCISITFVNSLILFLLFAYTFTNIFGIYGLSIGYVVSPIVSLLILSLYILIKYGKKNIPFIRNEFKTESYNYDLILNTNEIMKMQHYFKNILDKKNISYRVKTNILILCEDLLIDILDKNNNQKIYSQCSLIFDDTINFIVRDDGKILDITDPTMDVTSLRSMVVSSYMEYIHDKTNLVTTSYNRNIFKFQQ